MAYRTPEERISDLVGRGWRGLANRFERLRGGTAQAAPPPVVPVPVQEPPSQLAKVPANISGMFRSQPLVSSHSAVAAPPVQTAPQNNFIRDAATGATVSMDPAGGMRWTDQAGNPITKPARAPGEFTSVGQPIRPTAQIERFQANLNTPRGRFFGVQSLPGTDSSSQGSLGEEVMRGAGLRRAKAIADTALQARGQDLEMEQAGLRNQIASEQNRLLAERNDATLPGEVAQGEAAQLELDTARKAQGLLDQFNVETDETKKSAILQQYKMLTGIRDAENKTYSGTEETTVPGEGIKEQAYVIERAPGGGWRKIVPQASGQGDLQALAGSLKPEQRSKAAEYIKAHPEEDKAEVLRRIIAGEL